MKSSFIIAEVNEVNFIPAYIQVHGADPGFGKGLRGWSAQGLVLPTRVINDNSPWIGHTVT